MASGETTTRQQIKTRLCLKPERQPAGELLTPNLRGGLPEGSQGNSSAHTLEEGPGRMTPERKRPRGR